MGETPRPAQTVAFGVLGQRSAVKNPMFVCSCRRSIRIRENVSPLLSPSSNPSKPVSVVDRHLTISQPVDRGPVHRDSQKIETMCRTIISGTKKGQSTQYYWLKNKKKETGKKKGNLKSSYLIEGRLHIVYIQMSLDRIAMRLA